MPRRLKFLLILLLASACGAPPPPGPPATLQGGIPPGPPPSAAPSPAPPLGAPPTTPAPMGAPPPPTPEAARPAEPPVAIPAGAIYACVVDAAGGRQVDAIEFTPRVAELCAKNPEMGPCQYEREICRSRGGRVYAADGKEITKATEAEYDRRVLRVRINSN